MVGFVGFARVDSLQKILRLLLGIVRGLLGNLKLLFFLPSPKLAEFKPGSVRNT